MGKNKQLTVIDFFCGAGGFSEGFRQQGFKVLMGIDNWRPAVETHNLNHGLNDAPTDVLLFSGIDSSDVQKIEELPDSDVIIGSPPCVLFSMANKAGKADKTLGIKLIEAYLRVIAVKKHKKNSILKAWLMENVPNSGNYIQVSYTFAQLNLSEWAEENGIKPSDTAIKSNGKIFNASHYGAPQNRDRFVCGEVIAVDALPEPKKSHDRPRTLKSIKSRMPKPNSKKSNREYVDPNYPNLTVPAVQLTDHFYDTGLYITEWEQAKYLKTMHPFMGKMSFPENENKPSRTITATRSVSTRESLIYGSEYVRKGNGEYRLPTIREAATLMGYPYVYQFTGSEATKWKLIGNSVSPQLSSALAAAILSAEGREAIPILSLDFSQQQPNHVRVHNLNTYKEKTFDGAKVRKSGAKFRRTLHKERNTTIDLLNYQLGGKDKTWSAYTFYGTGQNHTYDVLDSIAYKRISALLSAELNSFTLFVQELDSRISHIGTAEEVQRTYEADGKISDNSNPLVIISHLRELVEKHSCQSIDLQIEGFKRQRFSLKQALFMFSVTHLLKEKLNAS